MIQAYFKGKLRIKENYIEQNEDLKTSSSIGLLQYLPDDVFWLILRDSCVGFDIDDKDIGKILSFNFWPHTDCAFNKNYVEPDVWIETEKYDVIIEAKKGDDCGQSEYQWQNEIESIKNEQRKNGTDIKPIILIALAGNNSMKVENTNNCKIYKASWYNLLNSLVNVRYKQTDNFYICRVLDDAIDMFAFQGLMKVSWFDSLLYITIKDNFIVSWKPVRIIKEFSSLSNIKINNLNLQLWKLINYQKCN